MLSIIEEGSDKKMLKGISFFLVTLISLFLLSGCLGEEETTPKIIGMARHSVIRDPVIKSVRNNVEPFDYTIPRSWYPPKHLEKGWKGIIIHHSLTKQGNAAVFDNYHKNGHKWKGIGYDFVIGNGNGSGDGQVEVTFRWREQIAGAHCGGTPDNWANKDGVGICLVGDFSKTAPTNRQMQSLVKLIRFLQRRYSIPTNRIYGHKDTPGFKKGGTGCPGNFPMARLKKML
jgi:N-acetylmuramoyl-L-alanine amidase